MVYSFMFLFVSFRKKKKIKYRTDTGISYILSAELRSLLAQMELHKGGVQDA